MTLGALLKDALFSLAPAATQRRRPASAAPSESVQEDVHTHSLLFPDTALLSRRRREQLYPLASAYATPSVDSVFDVAPEVTVTLGDVRLVVWQDATTLMNSAVRLYDSHALQDAADDTMTDGTMTSSSTVSGPPSDSVRTARGYPAVRRLSVGQTSRPVEIADPRPRGAFDRRSSAIGRHPSSSETESQRLAREYAEEMSVLSACAFGGSGMFSRKSSGTKVHMVPIESRAAASADTADYPARASYKSTSRLSTSFSSEIASVTTPRPVVGQKILITRIFPVDFVLRDDGDVAVMGLDPPPANADDPLSAALSRPVRARTVLYAIGMIITLPPTRQPTSRLKLDATPLSTEVGSETSSGSPLKPPMWSAGGDSFTVDSLDASVFVDGDDQMDVIIQHWDIVTRTMSRLQHVAKQRILACLRQADTVGNAMPMPGLRQPSVVGARASFDEGKGLSSSQRLSTRLVCLRPDALASDEIIRDETERARDRVVQGIRCLQVITRQGRWPMWRDEALWITKWLATCSDDMNSRMLSVLLTVFLGTHTDWLQSLAPPWYKRQHAQQQHDRIEPNLPLKARTIILADDKMAARRLIFLLSAFLAPGQSHDRQQVLAAFRPTAPLTSSGYSESPPNLPVSREAPLRRNLSRPRKDSQISFVAPSFHMRRSDSQLSGDVSPTIAFGSASTGAASTTTSISAINTLAHSSARLSHGGKASLRFDSTGSIAADDLVRSLQRSQSASKMAALDTESQGEEHVGRRGSMGYGPGLSSAQSAKAIRSVLGETTSETNKPRKSRLTQMVEARRGPPESPFTAKLAQLSPLTYAKTSSKSVEQQDRAPSIFPHEKLPHPIKTYINPEDGALEIDFQLPDFLNVLNSTISSPSSSGFMSDAGSGLDKFERTNSGLFGSTTLNVGGWLPSFHPDFAVQALPKSANVLIGDKLRAAMIAEPIPPLPKNFGSGWVDVSTAIVVDTITLTITRLHHRRYVTDEFGDATFSGTESQKSKASSAGMVGKTFIDPPGSPDNRAEFVEDIITAYDDAIDVALRRALNNEPSRGAAAWTASASAIYNEGKTQGASKPSSRRSSKSRSKSGKRHERHDSESGHDDGLRARTRSSAPRMECKRHILGTLEKLARDVADDVMINDRTGAHQDVKRTVGLSAKTERSTDSDLRSGIRQWLRALDQGAARVDPATAAEEI